MSAQSTRLGLVSVLAFALVLALASWAPVASAQERELDEDTAPSSAKEIETSIDRIGAERFEIPPLFPNLREQLQNLPAFFADTRLETRVRTYYLRNDDTNSKVKEAWALGGSIYYRSGWFHNLFRAELEGFTSQPLLAEDSKDGTLLLEPDQDGFTTLGVANGRLQYGGVMLTGGRQILDLPYVNAQDNRMVPNTFESLVLAKPEGSLRFSTGYTWNIKPRNDGEFQSMADQVGVSRERGLAHGGVVWSPSEDFSVGGVATVVPDLFGTVYSESSFSFGLPRGWEARLDGQVTFQFENGDKATSEFFSETWSLGGRASASYKGAVFRMGFGATGANGGIFSPYGSSPSYVNLIQRDFTRESEKALLASISYDFKGIGAPGLSAIVNFVAGFDGQFLGETGDAQEVDLTIDLRPGRGWLTPFWLRLRGSWLNEEIDSSDGWEARVIVRYDFPVI